MCARLCKGIVCAHLGFSYCTSAVFFQAGRQDATPALAEALTCHSPEDEDDREVILDLFNNLDLDKSGTISRDEFHTAIQRFQQPHERELADALKVMMDKVESAGVGVEFNKFYSSVMEIPRPKGQRVQWVRTLGLEWQFARLLKKGDFFDGVRGLR